MTMLTPRTRLSLLLSAAAVTTLMLSSCSSVPSAASIVGPDDLVIIASAHQNEAKFSASSLPPKIQKVITAAAQKGSPITIIGLDGTPSKVKSFAGYTLNRNNPETFNQETNSLISAVVAALNKVRADSDGDALGTSFSVAVDQLKSDGAKHGEIVVLDSGLSTDVPDFSSPGMLQADKTDIVDFVKRKSWIPRFPTSTTVDLVGFGYSLPPQPSLTPGDRALVRGVWSKVLSDQGATVRMIDEQPDDPKSPDTPYTVATATPAPTPTFQPPPAQAPVTIVYGPQSPVGFVPDSSGNSGPAQTPVYRDPTAAASALAQLASWLKQSTKHHADIVGTTADAYSQEKCVAISQARADKVRADLIALGVDPGQITATGVGYDFAEFVPDTANGVLDPGRAALNMSARITLSTLP